jgi:hypothetical protein
MEEGKGRLEEPQSAPHEEISGTGVVPSESEAKVVEMGETAIPDGGGHVACAPHGKVRFCRSSKRGQVLAL